VASPGWATPRFGRPQAYAVDGSPIAVRAAAIDAQSGRDLLTANDVVSDAAALASASVTATVVEHTKGPKIRIHKFKNKTRYHKRQGHRQRLTEVKITAVGGTAREESAEQTGDE
jgi:ribosomal protein L21